MRTLPTTVTTSITQDATRPAYLLRLGFSNSSPMTETLAATWDSNIIWNGETWLASGVQVKNLTRTSVSLEFPLGENDPWLDIIKVSGTRGRSIKIYQHYTDLTASPQAGAVFMFTGIMDQESMEGSIKVSAQEKSRVTSFPPESVGPDKFNFLLKSGEVIDWNGTTLKVR